jgi:hypothetical protein
MDMKRAFWLPILIGSAFGLLAGISLSVNLVIITSSSWAIGFYVTLYLLSTALGGPLAGLLTPVVTLTIIALFGYPELKTMASDPVIYWTNVVVIGGTVSMLGFAYRFIFRRYKMPMRLLPWAGIAAAYYIISVPSLILLQSFFIESGSLVEAFKGFLPQLIFDVAATSLIWLALPEHFRKPLWVEPDPDSHP